MKQRTYDKSSTQRLLFHIWIAFVYNEVKSGASNSWITLCARLLEWMRSLVTSDNRSTDITKSWHLASKRLRYAEMTSSWFCNKSEHFKSNVLADDLATKKESVAMCQLHHNWMHFIDYRCTLYKVSKAKGWSQPAMISQHCCTCLLPTSNRLYKRILSLYRPIYTQYNNKHCVTLLHSVLYIGAIWHGNFVVLQLRSAGKVHYLYTDWN